MRAEIAVLAGARGWGDTRASWLARVPGAVRDALGTKKITVPYRTVKALFYGEISDPEHHAARDVRRAAEIVSQRRALAEKLRIAAGGLDATTSKLDCAEIALLERAIGILGRARLP
jgi:hypothetical protein